MSSSISPEDKPFYALGVNIALQVGSEIKGILSKEELQSMLSGFNDSILDKVENERSLLQEVGPELNKILTSRTTGAVDIEKQNGKDFIASYIEKNPTSQTTSSGLVYHETVAGSGDKPTIDSTVLVHYHGTLSNGKIFDSSVERGEPIQFPLRNVIKGWQEGVAMMSPGGKATLVVPSDLAYGDQGSPPVIPAGATLQFDVELLEIKE